MNKALPQVVLVGRINAGKSTLFNTLSETGQAIVSPIPGTTRDLNYAKINWREHQFTLIDTGGLDAGQLGQIEGFVQKKAFQAIEKADLIVHIIDGHLELTSEDRKISKQFKKDNKKTILVINKVDGYKLRTNVSPDFYKLGYKKTMLISAINGVGTGDLLDEIINFLPVKKTTEKKIDLKLSIIGKTNVGKSSILNAILGEEWVIVTPYPHTTREPQDTTITYFKKNILLVDTAGLRKRGKISDRIEKISAAKTITAIKRSDICLFVTDASQPLSTQDQIISELAVNNQNGIIIIVNKWDLIQDKTPQSINKFIKYYQRFFPQLWWAPIIFVSAVKKQRTSKLIKLALEIQAERQKKLKPGQLQLVLDKVALKKSKPSKGKKSATIHSLDQISTEPPAFQLQARKGELIHKAYLNLLEKQLRKNFGFNGTSINISLKEK